MIVRAILDPLKAVKPQSGNSAFIVSGLHINVLKITTSLRGE